MYSGCFRADWILQGKVQSKELFTGSKYSFSFVVLQSPEKHFSKWGGSITPMQCCAWTLICFIMQINKCSLQQKKLLKGFKLRWEWLLSYWRHQKWCLTPLLCSQTWTLPGHLHPFHEKRKYGAVTQIECPCSISYPLSFFLPVRLKKRKQTNTCCFYSRHIQWLRDGLW